MYHPRTGTTLPWSLPSRDQTYLRLPASLRSRLQGFRESGCSDIRIYDVEDQPLSFSERCASGSYLVARLDPRAIAHQPPVSDAAHALGRLHHPGITRADESSFVRPWDQRRVAYGGHIARQGPRRGCEQTAVRPERRSDACLGVFDEGRGVARRPRVRYGVLGDSGAQHSSPA